MSSHLKTPDDLPARIAAASHTIEGAVTDRIEAKDAFILALALGHACESIDFAVRYGTYCREQAIRLMEKLQ